MNYDDWKTHNPAEDDDYPPKPERDPDEARDAWLDRQQDLDIEQREDAADKLQDWRRARPVRPRKEISR